MMQGTGLSYLHNVIRAALIIKIGFWGILHNIYICIYIAIYIYIHTHTNTDYKAMLLLMSPPL